MLDSPTLPESAHDRAPHHVKGLLLQMVARTIKIAGVIVGFAAFLIALYFLKKIQYSLFIGVFASVPFMLLDQWILAKAKANLAIGAIEVLKHDFRPPVLYLRSFGDDLATSRISGVAEEDEEEMVASALRHIGPFVAIGNPAEGLPRPGAARLYVSNEEWKEAVHQLMDRSKLIIIRVGTTQGLWWEIVESIAEVKPTALLLLVPFGNADYATFKQNADKVFPKPLPEVSGPFGKPAGSIFATISFHPDWTPELRFAEAQLLDIHDAHAVKLLIESIVSVGWQPHLVSAEERFAYERAREKSSDVGEPKSSVTDYGATMFR